MSGKLDCKRQFPDKIISSCALFGVINLDEERFGSADPVRAISLMRERGNGLGAGFAIYGIYPEFKNDYAMHLMYTNSYAKKITEKYLSKNFRILMSEEIPIENNHAIGKAPIFWRYFLEPSIFADKLGKMGEDDLVVEAVMRINARIDGAFVMSSGKNMGVFKGIGFPEDIASFFCLHEYRGYMWICHARFPTNTPGWWGGAHPFSLLDWSVAHNGELSSYGTNRRYLEAHGYKCTMHTDTEVITYAFDLLSRRSKLPMSHVARVMAPPYWTEIDLMETRKRTLLTTLRIMYASLMLNGPFSIVVGHHGEMIGLTDRKKLRPLVAGKKDNVFYVSTEESAIRLISPVLDSIQRPSGGELIAVRSNRLFVPETSSIEGAVLV